MEYIYEQLYGAQSDLNSDSLQSDRLEKCESFSDSLSQIPIANSFQTNLTNKQQSTDVFIPSLTSIELKSIENNNSSSTFNDCSHITSFLDIVKEVEYNTYQKIQNDHKVNQSMEIEEEQNYRKNRNNIKNRSVEEIGLSKKSLKIKKQSQRKNSEQIFDEQDLQKAKKITEFYQTQQFKEIVDYLKNLKIEDQDKENSIFMITPKLIIPQINPIQRKIQKKSDQKLSQYHNYTKLYFNAIIKYYQHDNILKIMKLSETSSDFMWYIRSVLRKIKESGRKKSGKYHVKTDFYSQAHYQLMFMQLDKDHFKNYSQNCINLHFDLFGINLKEINQINYSEFDHIIKFINLVKSFLYQIFKRIEIEQEFIDISTQNLAYWDKIKEGVSKMNQGILINRFI